MNTSKKTAQFRFYEELNDFLPEDRRKISFDQAFNGKPGIRDVIESLGVPHTEIDLILVDGQSVDFTYQLHGGEHVSVYPMFESFDIQAINQLRDKPLREIKFVLDVHLGKLARYLRFLGFDCLYDNHFEDPEIATISAEQHRIALTRDKGLLKHKKINHGYWIRATDSKKQLAEVIERFDLKNCLQPFTRCSECNGIIHPVDKHKIIHLLEQNTQQYYDDFYQCSICQKIYWRGSHFDNLWEFLDGVLS